MSPVVPDGPEERTSPFDSMRRRREATTTPLLPIIGGVALLAVAGLGAWYLLRTSPPEEETPVAAVPAATDSTAGIPPIDLPPLDASDEIIRGLIARISSHPQLAAWLVTDDLARRFVSAIVSLAGGRSPSVDAEFLVPEQPFRPSTSAGRTTIDAATHQRYDLMTEAFVSLDTRGTATLYSQLRPLFLQAYGELGLPPDQTWDHAVALAVQNVLAARVPPGPIVVAEVEGWYVFADPALEDLSATEKHMIRLGPANASRVQAKLRELAQAIAIPAR